jgi:glutathione S-transferase
MALDFYYASGSPYAWRVWLALEHKAIPYQLKLMSFDRGDLKTPQFTALNPRQKVPVIADGEFALYESAAIVEYLEDAHPKPPHLFPTTPQQRATVRRLVREADEYLAHAMEALVDQVLFTPKEKWSNEAIGAARDRFAQELGAFAGALEGDYFAEHVGAADFTIYPMIALALRMERRKNDLAVRAAVGPKLEAWMRRIESLPYFEKTLPPHWK